MLERVSTDGYGGFEEHSYESYEEYYDSENQYNHHGQLKHSPPPFKGPLAGLHRPGYHPSGGHVSSQNDAKWQHGGHPHGPHACHGHGRPVGHGHGHGHGGGQYQNNNSGSCEYESGSIHKVTSGHNPLSRVDPFGRSAMNKHYYPGGGGHKSSNWVRKDLD